MNNLLSQLENNHRQDQILARDSNRTLSLAQLLQQCKQLITILLKENLDVLALFTDNSIDWLIVDLACQKAGIRLLPLPTFFSAQQLQHAIDSVQPDALITDEFGIFQLLYKDTDISAQALPHTTLDLYKLAGTRQSGSLPDNTGKITFTSGSTGAPKGVCLSNEQLLHQAQALAKAVNIEQPKHLCVLPLTTLLENVGGLYAPLLAGGEVITPSLRELGFSGSSSINPQQLLGTISHYQANTMILTPQLLMLLVSAAQSGWQVPETLQFIAVGGSRVSPDLMQQAHALGIPAYEGYGLSECASVVCLNTPDQHKHSSSGQALPHLQIDTQHGEIVITGNSMLGYVNEPQSWGHTSVQSGDIGHLDDQGFLHISGRSKNLLISSFGRNISPEWIESELLANPILLDCVVYGDARPYCIALISPRNTTCTNQEIQQWLDKKNAKLPDYARIKHWYRLPQALSAQQQLVTDNGRPRRTAIFDYYHEAITKLYSNYLQAANL